MKEQIKPGDAEEVRRMGYRLRKQDQMIRTVNEFFF